MGYFCIYIYLVIFENKKLFFLAAYLKNFTCEILFQLGKCKKQMRGLVQIVIFEAIYE